MRIMVPHHPLSRFPVVALLTLIFGCGATDSPVPAPVPAADDGAPAAATPSTGRPIRIVFIGDSLSAGFGLAEAQAFPSLVQDRLRALGYPVEVLNAGVSGDTTAGGLARIDWVLRSEPDLLVVELGANDALRGQPLANTERNLRRIVRRGRESGARVLLLGMDVPTNYGPEYAGGFAELYARIAEEEEVALLPGFIRNVALDSELMMPDGLHPTAEGHRELARVLVDAIRPLLAAPERAGGAR